MTKNEGRKALCGERSQEKVTLRQTSVETRNTSTGVDAGQRDQNVRLEKVVERRELQVREG